MKKILLFILSAVLILPHINAEGEGEREKKEKSKADSIKTGWTFGALPVVAYDRDIGFKYGALVNFYNFGDGSRYPMYDHSLYLEYSRTTKGSNLLQFQYDADRLIPGIRTAFEARYATEQGLDFYGFNGYQAKYDHAFETEDDTANYISRMFYRQDRKLIRIKADFSGDLPVNNLKWFAGVEFYHNKIDTINLDKLNKGKEEDLLPPIEGGLYQNYLNWGIIPANEATGGIHTLLKAGIIFDTRDNEPNPMRGIWTDAVFIIAPGFLGDKNMTYGKLAITHRQYFTIIPRNLNFAYRLSYQGKLFGEIPSYMLPLIFNSPPNKTRDGLGGRNTVRGLLRNRVVGEGYLYGNAELRWKFIHTKLFKQNFHIALSAFFDAGMVVQEYEVNTSNVPDDILINGKTYSKSDFFTTGNDKPHFGTGAGIRFVLNDNFILAFDYGFALRPGDDGGRAPYIDLDWLF
jgi:outer membrane protein assembly factor BamA